MQTTLLLQSAIFPCLHSLSDIALAQSSRQQSATPVQKQTPELLRLLQ